MKPARNPGASQDDTAFLAEAVDALTHGLAIFDQDARLVRANVAFGQLNSGLEDILELGLEWDQLLVEWVAHGLIESSTRDRLQNMEALLADGNVPSQTLVAELKDRGFHEFAMRQIASGGFILTQADVTAREMADEQDREVDELLREVIEACPASLVMSRIEDGHIIYRSPAARERLGTAKNSQQHFESRVERADFVTALLPEGRVDDMSITLRDTHGNTFPSLVSARLIEYRGYDVVVSSLVDITKEVALRKRLASQRERIFQSEKLSALGELLAGVAHELNNPLSVVVGHALMMREEATDPETLRRVGQIGDAAERCTKIVKSFLAMARQQDVDAHPVTLREILDHAQASLEEAGGTLGIEISNDVPADLPMLHGDASQLEQVFMNLMLNAEQAAADVAAEGKVAITARQLPGEEMIAVELKDNGPGIPDEVRKRVFEPLFTTKEAGKGTGIGLSFCHRVIASHGGTIELMPSPEGAHFRITLPVAKPASSYQPASPRSPARLDKSYNLLIIDDEPEVASLMREILKRRGYRVTVANSGEAGLKLVQSSEFDGILTDINMPGIGGQGFYEKIAADNGDLAHKVAFVTGDTMSPKVRSFLDRTGRLFLEKPISPSELRGIVDKLVGEEGDDG